MSRGTVLSVQWLRGLAACAVLLRHAETGAEKAGWLAPNDLDIGLWGVDLFFVISGFIMALTTAGQPRSFAATRDFWRRRIVRVVPIYWLLTTLVVAVSLIAPAATGYRATASHLLASYLFIPMEDVRGIVAPPLRVGWSLNFEMYFYLVFGLLLLLPRRWLAAALTGWVTLSVLLGQWLSPQAPLPVMLTQPCLIEFACGAGLGLLHLRRVTLPVPAALALVLAGLCAFIVGDATGNGHDLLPRLLPSVGLLYGLTSLEAGDQAGRFNFRRPAALALGDWSYSLYLTHILTLTVLTTGLKALGAARFMPGPILFGLSVLVAIGVSGVVYRRVEQPLQRLTSARRPQPVH